MNSVLITNSVNLEYSNVKYVMGPKQIVLYNKIKHAIWIHLKVD
jgi:hypothetical protein